MKYICPYHGVFEASVEGDPPSTIACEQDGQISQGGGVLVAGFTCGATAKRALCDAGLPEPLPKPCARRMRSTTGAVMWCIKPMDHLGDCEGVTPQEAHLAPSETGPKRRMRWG